MSIIVTIIIGFLAGVLAKYILSSEEKPSGFVMTTILGIVGAITATTLGEAVGLYDEGSSAGFVGATIGAIALLAVWRFGSRHV